MLLFLYKSLKIWLKMISHQGIVLATKQCIISWQKDKEWTVVLTASKTDIFFRVLSPDRYGEHLLVLFLGYLLTT